MTEWRNRILGSGAEAPDQLLANPRNFRIHPKHQQDALAGVLDEVGWVQEVIVNQQTGHLIDGHLRVMLALRQGAPFVPCKYVDLSPAEEALILSTFDPISALAATDAAQFEALLHEVDTGSAAIQQLLDDLAQAAGIVPGIEPGSGGDDFDATPQEGPTRTAVGDLWAIGPHRLYVGDCTDPANVARLMGGERAALCVTDPPYAVNYDPKWRETLEWEREGTASGDTIKNDDTFDWLRAFDVAPYDVAYIWMASLSIARVQTYLEAREFILRYLIIWNKDLMVFGRGNYHWKHEPCLYMVRSGATGNWQGARDQKTVWDIPTIHSFKNGHDAGEWGLEGHGNQKPIECMQRPIENNSAPGALVYDPFLGSGTTLIAAHRTGRRCYGMEVEPKYADVVLRRATAEGLTCEKVS